MSDMVAKKEREQHETMATSVWTDQHGRRWAGMVDKDTQAPHTLRPLGWAPPVRTMVPPSRYHQYHVQSRTFTIDYRAWLEEYAEAAREWKQWELSVAKRFYGAAAMQKIKEGDSELRRETGEPPQDVTYIKAMAAGNKWALGLTRPDGSPYPRPSWADDAWYTWQVAYALEETEDAFGGGDAFPDVEEEPVAVGAGRPAWLGEDVFADEEPAQTTTRRSRKGTTA